MSSHFVVSPNAGRRGFALIVALALVSLLVITLALVTEGAVGISQQVGRVAVGNDAAFAVETVLLRREHDVMRLSAIGDGTKMANWQTDNRADGLGQLNYGVDSVNGYDVLWKIEPARTAPKGYDPVAGRVVQIPNISNPAPDPAYFSIPSVAQEREDHNELPNNMIYLYRIAAEAREHVTGSQGEERRRAQGARIVNISNQPLFRDVIFFGQKGPKGDLELSHADAVRLEGSLYSNGALYLGGGMTINDKLAQRGAINGSLQPTATIIGPVMNPTSNTEAPVQVTGYDGVFRLNKPLMFSIINGFPLSNTTIAAAGNPIGDWTDSCYSLQTGDFPRTEPGGRLDVLTQGGTVINPYRFFDNAGAVTRGVSDSILPNLSDSTGNSLIGSSVRAINRAPITGENDARDAGRSNAATKWVQVADATFKSQVRTRENGGLIKPVKEVVLSRGLEPQTLLYRDLDGRSDTDEHEYAQPQFIGPTGAITTDVTARGNARTDLVIENPGDFVTKAIGPNSVLAREPDGTGWRVCSRPDPTMPGPETLKMGLMIRERPVPQTAYWPGTGAVPMVDRYNPRYLPYAYGKQWYPTIKPFTGMDVSDNLMRTWRFDNGAPSVTTNISQVADNRLVSYAGAGVLTMTAAVNPGPGAADGTSSASGYRYPSTGITQSIWRRQYFYRDAWRFVHLGKYLPDFNRTGLRLALYRDTDPALAATEYTYQDEFRTLRVAGPGVVVPAQSPLPFAVGNHFPTPVGPRTATIIGVTAPASGVVPMTAGVPAWATTPAIPSAGYWSARWVGFWRPAATGTYTFGVNLSAADTVGSMARVWIDGQRVAEVGTTWTAMLPSATAFTNYGPTTPAPIGLVQNVAYPVVIEYAPGAPGAAPGAAPEVRFALNSGSLMTLQNDRVHPPQDWAPGATSPTGNTVAPPTVPLANFQTIQCRIDDPHNVASPANIKAGLMVRPEQVIAPLQQGGGAYAMVGWSQNRGFFTQRHVVPARQSLRSSGVYYIGNGPAVRADGTILDDSTVVPGVQRTASLSDVVPNPVVIPPTLRREDATNPTITYTVRPVPFAGTMNQSVGGHNIIILTPFSIGPYRGNRQFNPASRIGRTDNVQRTVTMANYRAPFLASDFTANPRMVMSLFTGATGTAQLPRGSGNMVNGLIVADRTAGWWASTPTGVPSTAAPITALSRIYTSAEVFGAWRAGTPYIAPGEANLTFGDAGSVWSDNPIMMTVDGGAAQRATLAALQSIVGPAPVLTRIQPAGGPVWPAVAVPAANFPSQSTLPVPRPVAVPLPGAIANTTFSLARVNNQQWFDLNPWVTGRTPLNAPDQVPALQYLPRPTGAGVWPAAWSVGAWPLSVGQRPDLWSLGTAQAPALVPTMADSALAGLAAGGLTDGSMTFTSGTDPLNYYRMVDDSPPPLNGYANATNTEVWLRIARDGNRLHFYGWLGTREPTATDTWTEINQDMDVTEWAGSQLLYGPCLQNGSTTVKSTVTFSHLKVGTTWPAPDDVIDQRQWDATVSTVDDLSLYMLSQYQVFYGAKDISEDFLTWRNATGRRLVSEDWFFQTREFWSQSRWWDHLSGAGRAVEKDPFVAPQNSLSSTINRRLLSKTTVLSLDLEMIQQYLRRNTLEECARDAIPWVGTPPLPYSTPSATMRDSFNGLIYAVRTNRYPWNPNPTGRNPATPHPSILMPNDGATGSDARIINGANVATWADALDPQTFALAQGAAVFHKLDGYALPVAPAVMPQNFHHGVRIINGRNINFVYPDPILARSSPTPNEAGGTDWYYNGEAPKFGATRLSVVTPNQLYLQGSLNVDRHLVRAAGFSEPVFKYTPLAVMGDQVTMLSNAWQDANYQVDGLTVANNVTTPHAGGTLAREAGTQASPTWYHAGIVTNNSPTTRERVLEGQGAPFTDTTRFLERWTDTSMNYLGSFIVLDSRRYSRSFLLDGPKNYGSTPFGIIANTNTSSEWLRFWREDPATGLPVPAAARGAAYAPNRIGAWMWNGRVPQIYSEAIRKYKYNPDFMTEEGTPPFVPSGVTSAGAGSWIKSFP